jgi:hypothetical protein
MSCLNDHLKEEASFDVCLLLHAGGVPVGTDEGISGRRLSVTIVLRRCSDSRCVTADSERERL